MTGLRPICCCEDVVTETYPCCTPWHNDFSYSAYELGHNVTLMTRQNDTVIPYFWPPSSIPETLPYTEDHLYIGPGHHIVQTDNGMEFHSFPIPYFPSTSEPWPPQLHRYWDSVGNYDENDIDLQWELAGILHEPYSGSQEAYVRFSGQTCLAALVESCVEVGFPVLLTWEVFYTKTASSERRWSVNVRSGNLQAGFFSTVYEVEDIFTRTDNTETNSFAITVRLLQSAPDVWELRFYIANHTGSPSAPAFTLTRNDWWNTWEQQILSRPISQLGDVRHVTATKCQNLWACLVNEGVIPHENVIPVATIVRTIGRG